MCPKSITCDMLSLSSWHGFWSIIATCIFSTNGHDGDLSNSPGTFTIYERPHSLNFSSIILILNMYPFFHREKDSLSKTCFTPVFALPRRAWKWGTFHTNGSFAISSFFICSDCSLTWAVIGCFISWSLRNIRLKKLYFYFPLSIGVARICCEFSWSLDISHCTCCEFSWSLDISHCTCCKFFWSLDISHCTCCEFSWSLDISHCTCCECSWSLDISLLTSSDCSLTSAINLSICCVFSWSLDINRSICCDCSLTRLTRSWTCNRVASRQCRANLKWPSTSDFEWESVFDLGNYRHQGIDLLKFKVLNSVALPNLFFRGLSFLAL